MEATVTLEYEDAKTAEAVTKAVSPDNFRTPKGLFVKTFRRGKLLFTRIEAEGKIATFTATIDDLLFCVSTAEKALRIVKNE